MICFKGKASKEVRSFARKKTIKVMAPFNITFFLVGIIPFIVDYHFEFLKFIFALSFVSCAIMWFLLPILSLETFLPQKVEIEDGFIEWFFVDIRPQMIAVDKVKRVTDRGNFYEIDFYFPSKMATCICQKDLLAEGTLEEFEDLFKDKLIRKLK